jgi:transcriptional regulator with XRE-family HTH domain
MQRKNTGLDLGQRLAATRIQSGLSQNAVAHRAGLAASYLSRIEAGKIQPTVPTANKIAAALTISLSELLAPRPSNLAKRGCQVSGDGTCLLDLLDPKWEFRSKGSEERYSPRQLRLLRRFAALLREGSPELIKGLELLVGSLVKAAPQQRVRRRRRKTTTKKMARSKAKRGKAKRRS